MSHSRCSSLRTACSKHWAFRERTCLHCSLGLESPLGTCRRQIPTPSPFYNSYHNPYPIRYVQPGQRLLAPILTVAHLRSNGRLSNSLENNCFSLVYYGGGPRHLIARATNHQPMPLKLPNHCELVLLRNGCAHFHVRRIRADSDVPQA